MSDTLMRTGVAGLERRGEANILVSLLSLTSDAVLVFDGNGTILLANEEAERTFREVPGSLVDRDVRMVFPPVASTAADEGHLENSLPFGFDGSSSVITCETRDHAHLRVRVRCERVALVKETYLLTAHVMSGESDVLDENERLVEELSRANRRLSGTLGIVLSTLDSLDVGTLFSRILDEITQTMDAWGTIVYMAEQDGYRLRGVTESLGEASVPVYMPFDHPLADAVSREGRSLCMRVLPPSREELRLGKMVNRTVCNEESGSTMVVPTASLPPFSSFVVVPVWFGGHMISLVVVGWKHAHRLRKDDARLLDSVAEYLSVQIAGAIATLRAQHTERLEALGSKLRERLLAGNGLDSNLLESVFYEAAEGVDATCVPLLGNIHQRTTMGKFPGMGLHSVPMDLLGMSRAQDVPRVSGVAEVDGLGAWLQGHGEKPGGLFVLVGRLGDSIWGFLLLREQDSEPFEEVDVLFVRRLCEDVLAVEAGEKARTRDKRISQALQRGMRNELQKVLGLSTQSCYSSATEAAYVGGDFYDLVKLPERHACVIMGDVSGKGVEAASVSSAVKTALGAYAWEGLKPARMVQLLNDFLLGFSRVETFATLFVGIVDLQAGTLTYCSAGHPPALLVRASSGELVTLEVQSGVVGAFAGMRYLNGEVELAEGDTLLLYTDGVTEARNRDGAFFGEDGLRDVVAREAAVGFDGLCDRVLNSVAAFAGNSLEDDVALVVVRVDELG